MEIELTNGMILIICGAAAFVAIAAFFFVYMTITARKMNKILKSNELHDNENNI